MVLWGGLRPIWSQFVLDVTTIVALLVGVLARGRISPAALIAASTLLLSTAGLTNRWTLSFPLVPILCLQLIRYSFTLPRWLRILIACLSVLFVLLGAALTILFPAVELPPFDGPFHVGVVDIMLPVEWSDDSCSALPVRILYPTLDEPDSLPYLPTHLAADFCAQMMQLGAPPPLKAFGWMLHT